MVVSKILTEKAKAGFDMKKNTDKVDQVKLLKRKQMERNILNSSILNEGQLYVLYATSPGGFSMEQAAKLLDEYGENVIDHGNEKPWWIKFALSFANPFNLLLFIIAVISFFTDIVFVPVDEQSWATVVIILSLIALSGILQFVQESKADKAAKGLESLVSAIASVIRGGIEKEIVVSEVVPGDIVTLAAGDMIPADLRILQAKDLFISQAALTGESEPVEKYAEINESLKSIIEAENIGFMGTTVISGTAKAIAIATGDETYLGSIAQDLAGTRAETSFEKGVADVSKLLLRLTLVMVPIILAVNGITKNDWMAALLFAMSVAVGITPELLPMIMTSTLAKGAVFMAKRKTIVKNLSSIQSFGAMDILCTDKTGTLTEDKIILERYLDAFGQDDMRVLRHAFLNSHFQTGLKNLMDVAIIQRARKEGYDEWEDNWEKTDEIPFDFNRRRMSVVITDAKGKRKLITKGAIEEMLKACSLVLRDGSAIPLTNELRKEILQVSDNLNAEGLRAIAVAQKNDVLDVESFSVADECDMVLNGFVAFLDPPKETASAAIEALHDHGVRVVVLTGDNDKVASTVCGRVGLQSDKILLGADVEAMTDDQLKLELDSVDIYAKLSPAQKARLVSLFQEKGHTIGYLGDGINDAPALRQADVGISVDTAVDIAKESADIILLEKSLMVLEEGVVEGRRTFGNIIKYIKMAASGNFGNMFSVLAASIFLPFLPMLPIQILAQNFLYDLSQVAIPFDKMDEEYVMTPQKWDAKGISRFTYVMGPISSIFDIITFIVLWMVFQYNTPQTIPMFQTGWFIVGLLTQTLVVHLIRTARIPFIESRAALPLSLSTIVVCACGIILPYTVIGSALGMTGMPPLYLGWVAVIILGYIAVTQLTKTIYIRLFNEWL